MIEIPLGLRTVLESGDCVLFLGAGIGQNAHTPDGRSAPDASTLAVDLANEFHLNPPENPDLARVAGFVEHRIGRQELETFLQRRLMNLEPDESLTWLCSRRWAAIFTTNYDNLIERAYDLTPNPPQKPVSLTISSDLVRYDPRFEVPICHLHGKLFDTVDSSVVITEKDYTSFRERRRMIFEFLKREFAESTVLYIGYSNRDHNWREVIDELGEEFYPKSLPQSYRISPKTDEYEADSLRSRNITTVNCTLLEFYETASLLLPTDSPDSNRYLAAASQVPSDLLSIFEKNPAPTSRLLSSWTYVNQEAFQEKPNVSSFLRGDRPNWALVGARELFERDIEESVYDDLLDYATGNTLRPRALIVLAPAGYGVSTLLMTLAARLVKDRAGPVYMLRPGSRAFEGDMEYATMLSGSRPFLFVNCASDHVDALNTILHKLEDLGKPALFVLGERLNEWRQGHGKLNVREYQIGSLSDPEINRLLDLLERHSQLGALAPLPRDLQFATIKQQHGKELLVALREVTEGRSFDAILEDEYHGIKSSIARRLYLAVCCFSQHGAYARDAILAQLLKIDLTNLYSSEIISPTEGVIVYDCVDQTRMISAARARHRIIASIVWERCSTPSEKDTLLVNSLSSLNLNYGVDISAFESFVRSDHTIDQIRSLDGKIQFFEMACKKDPTSPYVRQHYARMLMREKKTELALGQIEQAIQMDPQVRVLYHTRGMVFMELALSLESEEIARKRLFQSELSFRKGLSIYSRDEYCYQGLAQLYLGWAKRASTPEDSAVYISKAEEVINEGLRQVRVRYGLWIESSNIQNYLGDQPSRLEALEKAVRDAPGVVIPRHLLGRAYRRSDRIDDALRVLEPVIKDHPEEFRPIVEYALALAIKQQSYEESIAVLKLSTLNGYSDPRFIATLGGMLFMSGKLTEADKVFGETLRHDFTSDEANEIQFRPLFLDRSQKPVRVDGTVIVLRAGYAFVEAPGFGKFLCPGSKFNGLIMGKGLAITFEPVFSARGALALAPLARM